eukprot:TRINITY_DN11482_c0_g1_i3.p2 TRINITY_DN11482_c0_g1~~TRINITY_DN11482_c0_g1_i3.p2  ORF type:complete len:187 (-),score=0.01 TRINITY_DN11482_c0_g1_i3:303-863(-)
MKGPSCQICSGTGVRVKYPQSRVSHVRRILCCFPLLHNLRRQVGPRAAATHLTQLLVLRYPQIADGAVPQPCGTNLLPLSSFGKLDRPKSLGCGASCRAYCITSRLYIRPGIASPFQISFTPSGNLVCRRQLATSMSFCDMARGSHGSLHLLQIFRIDSLLYMHEHALLGFVGYGRSLLAVFCDWH